MPQGPGNAVARHLLPTPPRRLGIAVSGGSDSVALLHLLYDFAQTYGTQLQVVSVDHGLRAEAAQESAFVATLCAGLGLPHETVHWTGWDRQGNLQNEARQARYRLIAAWARARDIETVALGHTLDDQAETVLMRLARGAGVDGLSAMSPRRTSGGITWLRPLLDVSRLDLRNILKRRGVTWCDDPSNEDPHFDRVKVRQALAVLEPLGINAEALGQVAFNMSRARDALRWQAFLTARSMAKIERGAVRMNWRGYVTLPDEIARRLLVGAMGWISGSPYPPRRKSVLGLIEALKQGVSATADGCQVSRKSDALWVYREYDPVRDMAGSIGDIWDRRWRLIGEAGSVPLHIAALGPEGLKQLPEWRGLGVPRGVLLSTPAVWNGTNLVAAPLAGFQNGWHARPEFDDEAFFAAVLSH
ncbi:tRNA(Ile)-lysidine synthase [Roseobacter fucihabitans]|uniref:tRNA(Ile)-lysidine synthase n=1 Tax=Roseobacter fucihabitans TaxID=1537242 RepID=A0ABZ2BVV6_9RHOB|nr:tRNA(Ile)-lysidine synthase [Roseobacter litoralis]